MDLFPAVSTTSAQIRLIYISTYCISPKQFIDFIGRVKVCFVHHIKMRFSEKDTHSILLYINTIKNTEFLFDTKISIHLGECDLTDETAVDFFPPCSNQNLCELYLQGNNYSIEFQLLLANQFSTLEYLSFPPPKYRPPIHISFTEKIKEERTNVYTADYDILVLGLCQATQLKGLQIMESLDYCYFQFLKDVLPRGVAKVVRGGAAHHLNFLAHHLRWCAVVMRIT